jgi:anti-sigma regulatory factor (Ser/Thr protein kinase)
MTDRLDLELPADLDELAAARTAVRTWLAGRGLDEVATVDLLAVASEFLVHAIVRAGGTGTVRLTGEPSEGGIRLAVRATPRPAEVRSIGLPPDPLAQGALGRRLVEVCCHDLRIDATGTTLAECFRRRPD